MKKLPIYAGLLTLGFATSAVAESSYLPHYVEQGLIKICKTAAQDKLLNMNKSIKELNLKHKVVALNVVCNGQDIISFADRYGAERTTARLNRSVGTVEVTDIASIGNKKYDVTFEF